MITVGKNVSNKPFYNATNFMCDFASDVADLPTNRGVGSWAKVIETGEEYILNSDKEWILQPTSTSSSSSDSSGSDSTDDEEEEETDTIIYDGGVIE